MFAKALQEVHRHEIMRLESAGWHQVAELTSQSLKTFGLLPYHERRDWRYRQVFADLPPFYPVVVVIVFHKSAGRMQRLRLEAIAKDPDLEDALYATYVHSHYNHCAVIDYLKDIPDLRDAELCGYQKRD